MYILDSSPGVELMPMTMAVAAMYRLRQRNVHHTHRFITTATVGHINEQRVPMLSPHSVIVALVAHDESQHTHLNHVLLQPKLLDALLFVLRVLSEKPAGTVRNAHQLASECALASIMAVRDELHSALGHM